MNCLRILGKVQALSTTDATRKEQRDSRENALSPRKTRTSGPSCWPSTLAKSLPGDEAGAPCRPLPWSRTPSPFTGPLRPWFADEGLASLSCPGHFFLFFERTIGDGIRARDAADALLSPPLRPCKFLQRERILHAGGQSQPSAKAGRIRKDLECHLSSRRQPPMRDCRVKEGRVPKRNRRAFLEYPASWVNAC